MTTTASSPEYRAAHDSALLLAPCLGRFLLLRGRSPAKMLHGLAAGATPPELQDSAPEIRSGRVPTSLLLTPKGRILTEFALFRLGNDEAGDLLLHIPEIGIEEALAHFRTFLPPRFAKLSEPESAVGSLLIVGPEASHLLSSIIFGSAISVEELDAMAEREERVLAAPDSVGVRVVRAGEANAPSFEIVAEEGALTAVRDRLLAAGAVMGSDPELRDLLRIEKGRPRYGVEFDAETLPQEAGVQDRSIDHRKGCYTGQEVIVRIRDRGHVNRRLQGVLLGDVPPPAAGTPLYPVGKEEPAGIVRSAVRSPGFGETVALAYLRREVESGAVVHLGAPDGPQGRTRDLADTGWVLVGGDRIPVG